MTRALPQMAVDFVREHEGCRLTVYADSARIPTAGWGHVIPGGKIGDRVSRRQAELWLAEDLQIAAKRLARVVSEPAILKLADCQYAALVSFCFNVGCKPQWSLWKTINDGKLADVPAQLMRFTYAGGKQIPGLVSRRAAEVALWNQAAHEAAETPASSVTRLVDTPPAPQGQPKPAPVIAGCLAAAGGVAEGAKQVQGLVQPFAEQSGLVQHALEVAATCGAGAAVATAVLLYLQHRSSKR
jgi:GH24 family phage-related lysozyme (muramidase)